MNRQHTTKRRALIGCSKLKLTACQNITEMIILWKAVLVKHACSLIHQCIGVILTLKQEWVLLLDADWLKVLTRLIEAMNSDDGPLDLTWSSETEDKVKVAVLEAARRLSCMEEVDIFTEDEGIMSCIRSLKDQVKKEYRGLLTLKLEVHPLSGLRGAGSQTQAALINIYGPAVFPQTSQQEMKPKKLSPGKDFKAQTACLAVKFGEQLTARLEYPTSPDLIPRSPEEWTTIAEDQPEQRDSTPSATPTSSVESNDAGISASSRHAGTVESSPTERQAPESGTLYTRGQQPLLLSENQPGASPLAQHQPPGSVLSPCKSIVVKEAEKLKLDFIRGSKTAWDEFVQKLSIVHAEPEFTDDSAILHSTLNAEVQGAHKLAATWTHDVQEAVTKYLRGIAIHKITVTDDIWQTLETSVKDAASDSAFVHPLREEKLFAVVGFSSNATSLYEHIMETLESLKQEAERKKDEITERNRKLNSAQLRILAAMSFDVEVDKRYEGVKVDIDLGQREIIFRGIRQDVNDAQVDMYELLNQVKSKHIANISDSQRELLVRIETRSFVEDRFKSKGFVAIWEISNQEVQVYAFNDKCVEDAARIIRESVQTHNINLSRESTELIRSSDWQGWMKILEDSHPGRFLITLSQNDSQIVLTATSDIIHEVKERVECYLEKNTVYRQTFRLSESRQRFVKLFNEASLQEIQEKLKPHKVAVSLSETGTEIWVQGRKEGLQLVKNELTKLEGTIQCKMETIVDPAHIKFLTSENSRQELEKLGSRNHCIVSLDPESSGLQETDTAPTEAPRGGASVTVKTSVTLPEGITVSAVQGDITEIEVDAIVNAANMKMEHTGGIAKYIVNKGGLGIQAECSEKLHARGGEIPEGDVVVTGPCKLRQCRAIIHAVGPEYRDGTKNERGRLHQTVIKCLETASTSKYTSLAIPAISAGLFKYPPPEATRVIVEALMTYLESHPVHSIRQVYVCDMNPATVQCFATALDEVFTSWNSPKHSYPSHESTQRSVSPRRPRHADSTAVQFPPQPCRLTCGEIAAQQVDVIVNSADAQLNLKNGSVSLSIMTKAGPGLQEECSRRYPKGIKSGFVAHTEGHNLACSEVYHVTLGPWSPSEEKKLGDTVEKCLNDASTSRYQSIALPVLGTGNLGYPADAVARAMLGAVKKFRQTMTASSLQDIIIVVYPKDTHIMAEFTKESQRLFGLSASAAQTLLGAEGGQSRRSEGIGQQPDDITQFSRTCAPAGDVFKFGNVSLTVKNGDITEEDTDAIVNSTNSSFSGGGVASALRKRCGSKLEEACRHKGGDMKHNGIVDTPAFGLKTGTILHLDSEKYSDYGKGTTPWMKGMKLCLKTADRMGNIRSIAMPAVGTGIGGLGMKASAHHMFKAVMKFHTKAKNVTEVRVVIFESSMIKDYVDELHAQAAVIERAIKDRRRPAGCLGAVFPRQGSGQSRSLSQKLCQVDTYASVNRGPSEIKLFIYHTDLRNVAAFLKSLDDVIRQNYGKEEFRNPLLRRLEPEETKQGIAQLCYRNAVKGTVEPDTGRIILEGFASYRSKAREEIDSFVNGAILASMAQWYFLGVTKLGPVQTEYGKRENRILEVAYQNKEVKVELRDTDGKVYEINCNSMKEVLLGTEYEEAVDVIRRDKIEGSSSETYELPDFWEPQTDLVKVVPLGQSDPEFQKVEADFLAGNPLKTVHSVHRIQNITLHRQYTAKKLQMDEKNGLVKSNEMILWHGTSSDALSNINSYGFNRSYCGKNAVNYGEGVYFAVKPSYSARDTYSPPDLISKNRHVYRCKVLVGHTVKGVKTMRVLPRRSENIPYDSATDNPRNPQMYVIFSDTQAYPEYLITFR